MSGMNSGYFRRLVHRLTSDAAALDADELSEQTQRSGAKRACDCGSGEEVTVVGRLRSVEHCPKAAAATMEAELFDGTDGVLLVWMGRRHIPGIDPGRTIRATGRLADREGRKVLYNPYYELQTPAET